MVNEPSVFDLLRFDCMLNLVAVCSRKNTFAQEPFIKNPNICVIQSVKLYLAQTANLRRVSDSGRLFLITQKPFTEATKSTVARWIKLALTLAGADINIFAPHSTRAAATSAASVKVSIDTIIRTAGWTRDNIFRKFYKRPVVNSSEFSHSASLVSNGWDVSLLLNWCSLSS